MKQIREAVVLAVCLITLGFSVSALFGIWCMYRDGAKEYRDLQEFVEEETETDVSGNRENGKKVTVDFEALKMINEELVAWIRCGALGIDYPVVQGKDNAYYLNHTFSKEEHISGCIFMDYQNRSDFSDDNTILYGHNMKDGSMFGSFGQLKAEDANISIYTAEGVHEYQVIDNRIIDAADMTYFRIIYGEEDFSILATAVSEHSGAQLMPEERLLTLSTCNGDASKRHVILCREIVPTQETEITGETAISPDNG